MIFKTHTIFKILLIGGALLSSHHSAFGQNAPLSNEQKCFKLTRIARNYIRAGEPEKSLPILHEALTYDPSSVEAHLKLADALFSMQQFTPAIHACDYVISQNKEKGTTNSAVYRRGCCYGGLEKYDLALRDLNEVIKREPTTGRAYLAKGEVLRLKGDLKLAIASYHQALNYKGLSVAPATVYLTCAECQRKLSDSKGEREELTALLKTEPSVDALRLRGDSYLKDKLIKEAGDDYQKALTLEPDDVHCKEGLAACRKR